MQGAAFRDISTDVNAASLSLTACPVDALSVDAVLPVSASGRAVAWKAAELAARVHAGDEAAFRELHRHYASRLQRYALVMARGNEHVATETVQSTFLRAIRSLRSAADDQALWCWLAKAARCAAADAARREQRQSALLAKLTARWAGDPAPPAEEPEILWHQALDAAIADLPAEDQSLLQARYTERAPLAEIAARNGTTDRAVESRLARLRTSLRAAILLHLSRLP
jgi:RNA polymerase sigma-70 factor (ECF subfamily)